MYRMPTYLFVTITFIALLLPGCSRSAKKQDKETPNHEWIIFVARDVDTSTKSTLSTELQRLISTRAQPNDIVHLVVTAADHDIVASLTVPPGAPRTRLRTSSVLTALRRLAVTFNSFSAPYAAELQLEPPSVASTVQSLRRSDFPCRVVLIGSPLYHDPQQAGWSMLDGHVPTDAALNSPQCPFHLESDVFPQGCTVSWFTPSANWAQNNAHHQAVVRFYRLFFQKYGAQLVRVTSSSPAAFSVTGTQFPNPVVTDFTGESAMELVALESARDPTLRQLQPVRIDVLHPQLPQPPEPVPAQSQQPQPQVAQPPEPAPVQPSPPPPATIIPETLDTALSEAESQPDQIALAITWTSADPRCDLDLWIRNSGVDEELNFENKITSFGKLLRDVRRSSPLTRDDADYHNWECAIINHNRYRELEIWLNVFATKAPARVRLIAVLNGQRRERFYDLPVSSGDHADGHHNRARNPAWKALRLIRPASS